MSPENDPSFPASPAVGAEGTPAPTPSRAPPQGTSVESPPSGSSGPSGPGGEAAQRFVRGAHEAVDRAAENLGPTVERVRDHPLSSVAVGVALGMLIGRLTAR